MAVIANSNSTFYLTASNGNTITYTHQPFYPPVPSTPKKEEEVSKREDFEFPYTGDEIAAALEAKAAKVDAEVAAIENPDEATLKALYPNEFDQKDARDRLQSSKRSLESRARALRKEAVPYTKAGTKSFDLDLDDVTHFGLNSGV